MLKTIFFDLDGTLLPMDQEVFANSYFQHLAAKMQPLGYEPNTLIKGVWAGTEAMVKNNGACTNEEAFWHRFQELFGERAKNDRPVFDEYYRTDFQKVKEDCGFTPRAAETIGVLKAKGFQLVLATNPIFPATATESRIRWAGLQPSDFMLYTTYENAHFCKPNPLYYREIVERLALDPTECLMVGNDVEEDMIAGTLGMQVFLLTDCLINRKNTDLAAYPHGSFDDLLAFIG